MATAKARTRKLVSVGGGLNVPPTTTPPIDPDGGPDRGDSFDTDRPSPISAGEQDSLMDLLAGFTDAVAVTVKVYRVIRNKPLAYVYECSPETFSMDSLRDDYGGGEFRVYIHEGGRLLKNVRVMVEPPRKTGAASPEIDSVLASVRERQDKTDKLLEALAARVMAPPPAPPSLGSLLGQMDLPAVIGAVGTLLQVMRPPAPPAPVIAAPAADPMAGIDMFMKAFELARELQGDGGGEKSLMGVVSDLIKSPILAQAVQSAAEQQGQQQQQQQARQLPNPGQQRRPPQPGQQPIRTPMGTVYNPVPQQPQRLQPQQGEQGGQSGQEASGNVSNQGQQHMATVDTSAQSLNGHMEFLCFQAANGGDPELYAGLILDQLDDETLIRILDWQPDPVSALIAQYPQAAPHQEWFQQVVDNIQLAFDDDDGDDAGGSIVVANGIESDGQSTDSGHGDASRSSSPFIPGGTSTG